MFRKDEAKRRLKVGGGSSESDDIINCRDTRITHFLLFFHEEKLIVVDYLKTSFLVQQLVLAQGSLRV